MDTRNYLTLLVVILTFSGCSIFQKSQQKSSKQQQNEITNLPKSIYWEQDKFHVQGVAVDTERGFAYFSFTTSLIKTNLKGEIIGSIKGFVGHLGCIDINPEDGRIYASLEYKTDAIGKGISKKLGNDAASIEDQQSSFHVAIIDGEKIIRENMDAEKDNIVNTVFLKEALDDYNAKLINKGKQVEHRYGCSGIDGVAFGPQFGQKGGKYFLNVAYGIYGDISRSDNDYQVILQYDANTLKQYERPLSQSNFSLSGPEKPLNKYFLYTGNTTYGIQNLEYDSQTGYWFAAVYTGKKTQFPNYSLFAIDGSKKAMLQELKGIDNKEKVLQLAKAGMYDEKSGIHGWKFNWGATGLHSLQNGYFYISQNGVTKEKKQYSKLQLYRWTGDVSAPFEEVK